MTVGYPAEAQSGITVDLANGGGYVLAEAAVAPVPMTVVPNVLDEPLNMAREDIEAAGLRPKWGGGIGPVVFQAPKAGTSVPVGSTVTVVLGNN